MIRSSWIKADVLKLNRVQLLCCMLIEIWDFYIWHTPVLFTEKVFSQLLMCHKVVALHSKTYTADCTNAKAGGGYYI